MHCFYNISIRAVLIAAAHLHVSSAITAAFVLDSCINSLTLKESLGCSFIKLNNWLCFVAPQRAFNHAQVKHGSESVSACTTRFDLVITASIVANMQGFQSNTLGKSVIEDHFAKIINATLSLASAVFSKIIFH